MAGILGGQQQQGILGLLAQQQQTGQAPAYGSDPWAAQTGGPGALIWREMMRAMANPGKNGNPLGFMAPGTDAFSPELAALLGPQFQSVPKGK